MVKVSLVFFVLIAFTGAVLWLTKSSPVQGRTLSAPRGIQTEDIKTVNPLRALNQRARASKGTDPVAVRDLTTEVFATFAPTDVPSFAQEAMKDRVARAEVNYRQGVDKGISEVKVAKAVNELADKFALPDYAKVSVAMVRTARMGLMLQLPNLIAQSDPADKVHKKKKLGSSITPFMSPLEATTLTLFLLQQKTLNEEFQVSHKEFFANIHEKQMQRWAERRAQRDGVSQTTGESQAGPSMQARSNTKTDDVRQAIKKAAENMNPNDLLNLPDSSLDTLGIKR
jgi:hypothetical protein